MRDVILSAIMAILVPMSFVHPWIGVLTWSWFGYMNPHMNCWGFARWGVPWSEFVAIATLSGFVLTKDRKPFIWCRESILMIVLWIWFTITTVFSWYPDEAWWELTRVSKILLMTLMTIPLIQDRARMRWLLLVIAGSLGFYGVKAGLFVIASGGNYMVWGAPGATFVSSNNTIALALNMCLPLFWYLRKDETRRWLRHGLLATFWLSALAIPFTYSRGGMLGMACVLSIIFARSRRRYLALPVLGLAAVILFAVAPEKLLARMETLQTYNQDQSAMGRLIAWRVGYRIANDSPVVGGGFWVFNHPETFGKYAGNHAEFVTGNRRFFIDAHSIYFNLLGEHGYVGLGLFIILVLCTLASCASLYRVGRRHEELAWVSDYSYMFGASITTYLITGAFLSVAYFDLGWHLFALVVVLRKVTAQELESLVPVRARSVSQAAAQMVTRPQLTAPVGFRTGPARAS